MQLQMVFAYLGSKNSRKTFVTYDEKKRKLPIHVRYACSFAKLLCFFKIRFKVLFEFTNFLQV